MEKDKRGFGSHPENINRKGRPPSGESMADLLKKVMEEERTVEIKDKKGKSTGKTRRARIKELFIEAVLDNALDGKEQSQKTVMNYYDGYPKQNIEVEGKFATIQTDIPLTPEQEKDYAEKLNWIFKDKDNADTGSDIGRQLHEDESSNDVDGAEIPSDA